MRGLGILILVIVFFWVIWPVIARWLKRKAMERAEDYVRASMGMPPREKRKRGGKKKDNEDFSGYQSYSSPGGGRERRNPFGPDRYTKEPIIPKDYAEDVEFTETIDYSEDHLEIKRESSSTSSSVDQESQISDAEWTEIKKSRSK